MEQNVCFLNAKCEDWKGPQVGEKPSLNSAGTYSCGWSFGQQPSEVEMDDLLPSDFRTNNY